LTEAALNISYFESDLTRGSAVDYICQRFWRCFYRVYL